MVCLKLVIMSCLRHIYKSTHFGTGKSLVKLPIFILFFYLRFTLLFYSPILFACHLEPRFSEVLCTGQFAKEGEPEAEEPHNAVQTEVRPLPKSVLWESSLSKTQLHLPLTSFYSIAPLHTLSQYCQSSDIHFKLQAAVLCCSTRLSIPLLH